MSSKYFSRRPLVLLLTVILALGLFFPARSGLALTIEEEKKLGHSIFESLKQHTRIVEDPAINAYITQLGQKVTKNLDPQPFEFNFYVIDNPIINAFAVPGGYIFIHSGAITNLPSEGALAAIISHEIAHVTSRHIAGRMDQTRNLSLAAMAGFLAGAIIGGPAGQALMMGVMGGAAQAQLAYSREDESEADWKGLNYLVKAGYDPRFMAEAFQTMLRTSWTAPKDIPTYLTTHPGLAERISTVETQVITHPGYGKVHGAGDPKTFHAIQDRVVALLSDPTGARNRFEAWLRKNPESGSGHHGLALLYQRNQDLEQSDREFKLALKTEPANPVYLTDYGALLMEKKDFTAAREVLTRAVILRPDSIQALFLLAQTHQETGSPEKAQALLAKVLTLDPKHSQALYQIALLYGGQGDMARAHLHTGLYYQVEGELNKAMYHLTKAKQYAGSAPLNVQERIEKALEEVKQELKPRGRPD